MKKSIPLFLLFLTFPVTSLFAVSIFSGKCGGSGGHTIQDEGTSLPVRTNLNFTGTGVTCTDDSASDSTDCDIPGSGTATITLKESDISVSTAISTVDFGSGFDVLESPAGEGNISLDFTEVAGHDLFTDFVANEHIDHSTVTITAGAGLSGGGPITTSVTLATASQEAGFLADGGVTSLTCGAGNAGKMQVMDNGSIEYCDGAATPALKSGYLDADGVDDTGTDTLDDLSDNSLTDLSDVSIASPSSGQALGYNGTSWVNTNAITVSSGTVTNSTLTLVQSTTAAPTAEGVVEWDTDDNLLKIGDGVATKTFYSGAHSNSFLNVTDGTTTAVADSTTDTLTLSSGGRIAVTANATTDTVTFQPDPETYTFFWTCSIAYPDPAADDGLCQFKAPRNLTITEVACNTDTGTVDIQLDERAEITPNTAGTDILGNPATALQCTNTQAEQTTFSNSAIAQYNWVNVDLDASASSPGVVRITVMGTYDD